MRLVAFLLFVMCGGENHGQNVQVPPASPSCPEGTTFNGVACAEPLSTTDAAVVPTAAFNTPMAVDPARDPRRLQSRSPQLLEVELQALENLQTATSTNAPDYTTLARRIAEDWFELAYARAATGNPAASDARKKAITNYTTVTANASYAQMDDVLYYLGYAYELELDYQNARKTLFQLVVKFPSSPKIPYVYYGFGEMFAREAKSDATKWSLAKQAYLEARKFPDPNLQPWTLLRLGQVASAMGDTVSAQQYLAQIRAQYPQSAAAAQIP